MFLAPTTTLLTVKHYTLDRYISFVALLWLIVWK